MCADQLLLVLARREQIAALSWNAPRASMSYYADRARGLAVTRGSAEDVIARRPDLVIAGRFAGGAAKAAMQRAGLRVELLDIPSNPREAVAQVARFGALIGRRDAGLRAADALREALRARENDSGGRRPRALYLQRRGVVTGRGTMMDALMQRAGFVNAIAREGFGQLGIEDIATIEADILILDGQGLRPDGDAADQGAAILAHPLVQQRFPPQRRVIVPQREIVCAGPALASAMRRLRAARARFPD